MFECASSHQERWCKRKENNSLRPGCCWKKKKKWGAQATRGRRRQKRHVKSEFSYFFLNVIAVIWTLSTGQKMAKVSLWSYVSEFRKRNERHFLVLTSTIKRGISMFQVVVLRWLKARKLTKSVMLMQSWCCAHLNLFRFWLILSLPSPSSLFELHILRSSLL